MNHGEIVVSMAASRSAGLMRTYVEKLVNAGVAVNIEPMPKEWANNNLGDLGQRVASQRRTLEHLSGFNKIIIADAWDVLFYGLREELVAKVPDRGVLFSAERVCWPEPELSFGFPDTGNAWRYVNAGLMAGTHRAMSEWLECLVASLPEHGSFVDQRLLNRLRSENSPLAPIDSQTKLFYTMTQEHGELERRDGRPFNRVSGQYPNFIHFCAKTDPAPFLEMMKKS
jgi:hypothetical protein